ncbi:MAG: dihydroorotate dehydrogenase electron transfer subunit [Magnetococcales bacterium]|nr:dihydroorotate dehydrogenase electron transfer subunit [Magnetococcales bacterium]
MGRGVMVRERGQVVENQALEGGFHRLRLHAPRTAHSAQPGQFIHLDIHPALTLPRPFSLNGVHPGEGTVDLLYKVVGEGTDLMTRWKKGEVAGVLGPIGRPFTLTGDFRHAWLIAGGVGFAPLEFLARRLVAQGVNVTLFLGIEGGCPFSLSSLELLGIPVHLASVVPEPGYFQGFVTQLVETRFHQLPDEMRSDIHLFACGPTPMMKAVSLLAGRTGLRGEISLEEHMGCGFGGCAGCAAPIRSSQQDSSSEAPQNPSPEAGQNWNYQRVCVDGPVFAIDQVAWEKTESDQPR